MANLCHWHLYEDNKIIRAKGRVTHHTILTDSMDITTTEVKKAENSLTEKKEDLPILSKSDLYPAQTLF